MTTYGVHEAKTKLSQLLADVAAGGTVQIANRGKTVAELVPVTEPADGDVLAARTGFLPAATVPDDFDTMGADVIADMFEDPA